MSVTSGCTPDSHIMLGVIMNFISFSHFILRIVMANIFMTSVHLLYHPMSDSHIIYLMYTLTSKI